MFLRAAAGKQAAAQATAPTAASTSQTSAAAATAAATAAPSVMGVLSISKRKHEDLIPAAVRRVMTDKQSLSDRFQNGKATESVQAVWPDINNLLELDVIVRPKSGYWQGAQYTFHVVVPSEYPYKPPRVQLQEKIYHPNIDYEGNVCLDILRKEWKPVYTLENVLIGLEFLLLNPEGNDPLNHKVAEVFRTDLPRFEQAVNASLRGQTVDGVRFMNVLRR